MTITDPGNPDTGSYAVRKLLDGSPLDAETGSLGAAVHFERLSVADPAPTYAAQLADERLRQLGGVVAQITVSCVPQPWMQPGDVILLEYNGGTAICQVAGWQMNIGDRSEMSLSLRAWRIRSDTITGEHATDRGLFELSIAHPMPVDADTSRMPDLHVPPPTNPIPPDWQQP